MRPQIDLIRAIGSEFAIRKLRGIMLVFGLVSLALAAGLIWLTTLNAWWWLLAVPALMAVLLGTAILLITRLTVKALRPQMTKTQKKAVSGFVSKLERTADNLQTPLFIIVYRIVRDVVRPRGKSFIVSVA